MIPVITIDSFDSFARIYEQCHKGFRREKSSDTGIWYRGHECGRYRLIPKVFRPNYDGAAEEHFKRIYQTRYPLVRKHEPSNDAMQLAHMQHVGLPTRLLDWTESFLIAAYFAVVRPRELDSAEKGHGSRLPPTIWALDAFELARVQEIRHGIQLLGADDEHARSMVTVPSPIGRVLPVTPILDEPRLSIQQSFFTLHERREPIEADPDNGLIDLRSCLIRFEISEQFCQPLAKFLAVNGISEHLVFPGEHHLTNHFLRRIWGLEPW